MIENGPTQQGWTLGASGRLSASLLLVLILITFATHAYRLDAKSMWIDEGLSIYRAHQDLRTILSNAVVIQGFLTYDTHPPLHFLLLRLLIGVAGDSEFTLRFLSVAWGVLLVPLFYVFGKRLLGVRVGLWSATIAALSPIYLWYAQELRGYTMLVSLTLFSNYALLRLWQSIREGQSRPRRVILWVLAYILATVAAIFTHYGAIFVLLFQWVVVLALSIWVRRVRLIGLLVGASLFVVPFLPFMWQRMQTPAERGYRFVPLWEMARDLLNGFSLGKAVRLDDVLWLDGIFLAVFVLGVVMAGRGQTERRWWVSPYLLGYLLIPTLALYSLSHLKPMYEGVRHLLIVSPAYYLILAAGLDTVARRYRYFTVLLTVVLVGGVAYSTFNHFFDPMYAKDDIRSAVRYVSGHIGSGEVVVLSEPILSPLWEYYGSDLLWTALPQFPFEMGEETPKQAAALAETYDGIWFAYGPPTDRDTKGYVKAWFGENLFQIADLPFHSVNNVVGVAHYLSHPPLVAELPAMERETDISFGNELLLLGHDGLPDEIEASEELEVTFYWQVLSRPTEDYALSLRLTDEDGLRWVQTDYIPFDGFYATSHWQPDTVVAQTVRVTAVPGIPPGAYEWELRVYSPVTSRELEAFNGAGESLGHGAPIGRADVGATPATLLPQLEIQHRRQARFDDVVRLLGYSLAERQWRAGETLHLDLYWEYLLLSNVDHRVVVRVADAATGGVLRERTYPLGDVPKGSIARQQYRLVIPPQAAGRRCSLTIEVQDVVTGRSVVPALVGYRFAREKLHLSDIVVAEERRAFETPAIQHPLEAQLGENVQFLGYDLAKATAAPGGTIDLVLYWRASLETERSHTVFVHLLGDKGDIWAQRDSLPGGGARLTSGWMLGEVIVDRHEIPVAEDIPPGTYRLVWGMYDASTGVRLPILDTEGARLDDMIEGARIEVGPWR